LEKINLQRMFLVTQARKLSLGFQDPIMSSAFSMSQVIKAMFQEYLVRMYLPRVLERPLRLRLDKETIEAMIFRQRSGLRQHKEMNLLRKTSEESVFGR
jgi:hypothetical protein